jgi:hypothetical protein
MRSDHSTLTEDFLQSVEICGFHDTGDYVLVVCIRARAHTLHGPSCYLLGFIQCMSELEYQF